MNIKDTLNNVGNSITGNINKAMIYVKKTNSTTGYTNIELKDQLLKASSDGILNNPVKAYKKAGEIAGNNSIDGYHVMQVKYNPSSIKYSTNTSPMLHHGLGGKGNAQLAYLVDSSRTVMDVELIFDDVNIQDAFMWEKFSISTGSVISDIAGGINAARGKEYSVKDQIDGLLSLINQSEARKIVFYWSSMAFAGEVIGVNAKYTMFNPSGNPIRGSVTLKIMQSDNIANKTDEQYWSGAYNKLFYDYSKDNNHDDSKMLDKLGNILNI